VIATLFPTTPKVFGSFTGALFTGALPILAVFYVRPLDADSAQVLVRFHRHALLPRGDRASNGATARGMRASSATRAPIPPVPRTPFARSAHIAHYGD
jgi:hypothetical protein